VCVCVCVCDLEKQHSHPTLMRSLPLPGITDTGSWECGAKHMYTKGVCYVLGSLTTFSLVALCAKFCSYGALESVTQCCVILYCGELRVPVPKSLNFVFHFRHLKLCITVV
jgi:hypothetical protein